jgi:hypothetical protein
MHATADMAIHALAETVHVMLMRTHVLQHAETPQALLQL